MPSGYSRNLGLELMLTGENAGTWGEVTNVNLSALDDAIDGVAIITVGPGGLTITTANAPAVSDGRCKVLHLTGSLGTTPPAGQPPLKAVVNFAPDDAEKHYFIRNETNGTLELSQGSGARYFLDAGYSAMIHCDGMGIAASVYGTLSSFQCEKLVVKQTAELQGAITIAGAITMKEPVTLEKTLTVIGAATFGNNVSVTGTLTVIGASTLGPVAIASTLTVAGATVLSDTLGVVGNAQVNGTLWVLGAVTMDTSLNVVGAATMNGLTAANISATAAIGTPVLTVSGTTTLNVLNVSGLTTLASLNVTTATATSLAIGTLTVSGSASIAALTAAALTVTGGCALQGGCGVTGNVDASGSVISRAAMYIEAGVFIKLGADAVYDMYYRETAGQLARLPMGASGQFLRTNAGGWPEWRAADALPPPSITMGSAIIGGTHKDVLFNHNGYVSAGNLHWDFDVSSLRVRGSASSGFVLSGGEALTQSITFQASEVSRIQLGIATITEYGNANFYILRCNDAGTVLGYNFMLVRGTGRILMGGINQPTPGHLPGAVNIQPLAAAGIGLCIRRAGAQTAHLQVWQDEGGTDLSWINKDGVWGGAAGILNWIAFNRTNSWNFGADVNKGAMAFYKAALDATAGGFLSFNFGHGSTSGSFYAVLPTGASSVTGLTWQYRYGGAPFAQTFEEYQHESALGIVDNLLAHPDVVERLKAALAA